MNKTKIEWTNYTWNPITGCLWNCWYCYAKKGFQRFHRSFEPTFHPERLTELSLVKKPSKIFVCSVADLFAEWTQKEWVVQVLAQMQKYPQHDYQLLTKQPQSIDPSFDLSHYWVGVTINTQDEIWKADTLLKTNAGIKFASFEPILGEISSIPKGLDWIIVGKLTGARKVPLDPEWIRGIIEIADQQQVPLFIKNNIGWSEKIQRYPDSGSIHSEPSRDSVSLSLERSQSPVAKAKTSPTGEARQA